MAMIFSSGVDTISNSGNITTITNTGGNISDVTGMYWGLGNNAINANGWWNTPTVTINNDMVPYNPDPLRDLLLQRLQALELEIKQLREMKAQEQDQVESSPEKSPTYSRKFRNLEA